MRSLKMKLALCTGLLLLAVGGETVFRGVSDMYVMEQLVLNQPPSAKHIGYFTLQHLRREAVRMSAGTLPTDSSLPTFRVYASDESLAALDANLPASAKAQYFQAHLTVDQPGLTSQVKFRYRGNIPLHWLHAKKSLRIRLPDFTNFMGLQRFNLVNPSTIETVTDWLSYEMSREIGLLTPDYFPARVYINNEYNGLHFFLGQTDESLLRKNHRMPGNIYVGDNYSLENPFGTNLGINTRVFVDEVGRSLMWNDARLWQKSAHRNAESATDRRDIELFVSIVNDPEPTRFMRQFENHFDAQKYYSFWGLDTVVGSFHHDLYHNQKMYFDPYRGKFEPVQWDVRYWTDDTDMPLTPLLQQVRLNPVLSYRLDKSTFSLLKKYSVERIQRDIARVDGVIAPELAADPYRQQPALLPWHADVENVIPFFMAEHHAAIDAMKASYQRQHQRISSRLQRSIASYTLQSIDAHTLELNVAVTGNSPVEFSPWMLVPKDQAGRVSISAMYPGAAIEVSADSGHGLLYPGKKLLVRSNETEEEQRSNITHGNKLIVDSPLTYQYRIRSEQALTPVAAVMLRNAVTGGMVMLSPTSNLPSPEATDSVHPWLLEASAPKPKPAVTLAGSVDILGDRVFPEGQTVTIKPGTTFSLAKGASLVFYGRVLAEGSAEEPIRFQQKEAGEHWGSVIIKGQAANGSRLSHFELSGGSLATQRLINYPGQLNLHEVEDFEVSHCQISNNQLGDDALHVAYGFGRISHCHFQNTAFDAVDIDLATVELSNSSFLNIGNDAVDVMSSEINLSNITVTQAGDKCLSIGENSDTTISNSSLNNCLIGLAVKDESTATVNQVSFSGNLETAIALYRKNPRYSSGGTLHATGLSGISEQDIRVGNHSSSTVSATAFLPRQ